MSQRHTAVHLKKKNTINRHMTYSPWVLPSVGFLIFVQHRTNPENFECLLPHFLHRLKRIKYSAKIYLVSSEERRRDDSSF